MLENHFDVLQDFTTGPSMGILHTQGSQPIGFMSTGLIEVAPGYQSMTDKLSTLTGGLAVNSVNWEKPPDKLTGLQEIIFEEMDLIKNNPSGDAAHDEKRQNRLKEMLGELDVSY